MRYYFFRLIVLVTVLFAASGIVAQDVKQVDPKTLPESDIRKVENAIRESGLSVEEAADVARQRGATEQQIRDMQNRLQEGNTTESTSETDAGTDEEMTEEKEPGELSTRQAPIRNNIGIFGAYLFNNENLTFEPSINMQTPKNYEIGIGDQIIINIWGNSQNNYQLTVNKNGQLMIPDVGPVYIAGLAFEAAEEKIKQRLTEIYADMGTRNPQTFAQVNIGRLRSIKINLVGEVVTPGTFTLPGTATVFNALYLSGGPNNIGSFRNIRVIRDNRVFANIDIYDFLIDAEISENIRLKDDDIILIPAAEKRVSVSGEFKRNGVFEMKDDEDLKDLIRFAGGFTEDAYWSDLKIYRKTQTGKIIIDVPFEEAENMSLQDGDVVTNSEIFDSFKNRVTISGSLLRPGEYEWVNGMTLMDLILKADSLRGDAFAERGNIIRLNEDLTTSTISFDLKSIINGQRTIYLQPEDIVLIKSELEMKQTPVVSVSGQVMNPDQIAYSEGLTLGDAIFRAGGFTEAADSSFIEVARRLSYEEAAQLSDEMVHIFTFDLTRDLGLNEADAGFALEPFDRISVRMAPGYSENAAAAINGEVKYAGIYAIQTKNQRVSDLVKMAGGLTDYSFPEGATFSRNTEELGIEFVAIDLDQIMRKPGGENDLYLRDGDNLHIPERMQTVKVTGSVQNPFSITFEKGKALEYYIDKCGGFSSDALKRKVYVRYPNGATSATNSFIFKSYPEIKPGSQIVVPEKPEKKSLDTGTWLAIASTFSSLAIAVAAVLR